LTALVGQEWVSALPIAIPATNAFVTPVLPDYINCNPQLQIRNLNMAEATAVWHASPLLFPSNYCVLKVVNESQTTVTFAFLTQNWPKILDFFLAVFRSDYPLVSRLLVYRFLSFIDELLVMLLYCRKKERIG
jgi:hypothetical protein